MPGVGGIDPHVPTPLLESYGVNLPTEAFGQLDWSCFCEQIFIELIVDINRMTC